MPQQTSDPIEAYSLVEMDGAAILVVDGTSADTAVMAAAAVLGSRLRAYRQPVTIATNPTAGQGVFFDRTTRTVNADSAAHGPLHVDGYMMYGQAYPDVIFLLCSEQAPNGGANFIVDGLRLLTTLASDPAQRELLRFLCQYPLEQSSPTGVQVSGPIVDRTAGGRMAIRCHQHQRFPENKPIDAPHKGLLDGWRAVTSAAAAEAPRFRLRPGELLCLDNYRVFHGREAYTGTDRLLHRIWSWTDTAFGTPDPRTADGRADDITVVPW
ncbi:MAG: TauD/TfdA family dioxygenase [Pseudonocardiales bacterium]|nr:TauD/TfdA family dioxygenase [Pseudonocardiales bacterium]